MPSTVIIGVDEMNLYRSTGHAKKPQNCTENSISKIQNIKKNPKCYTFPKIFFLNLQENTYKPLL